MIQRGVDLAAACDEQLTVIGSTKFRTQKDTRPLGHETNSDNDPHMICRGLA